jgi:hypothetical protein
LHKIVVCGSKGGILDNLRVLETVRAGYYHAGVFSQLVNMFFVLKIVINKIIKFRSGFKISFRRFVGAMGDFVGQFVKDSLSKGFDFLFRGFATFGCQDDESCNKVWVKLAFYFPVVKFDSCGASEVVGLILEVQIIKKGNIGLLMPEFGIVRVFIIKMKLRLEQAIGIFFEKACNMLDFAEFGGKMFLVYYKSSNDSRTLIGVLLLLFRGIFFASIERIGIFYSSAIYSDAGRGMGIEESFGVFGVLFYRNKKLGLEIRNLVLEVANFSVSGFCGMRKILLDTF